jgi:hypothetical protein
LPNSLAQLSYQVCPIILTGGTASQIPGGYLPILSLFSGIASGGQGLGLPYDISDLDDAFGAFNVLPGGLLVSQTIGKYPFANQAVAANAVIREPLIISVIMDAPMRGPNAWAVKSMVMSALKATLDNHNNSGGTYTVATPAYMYDNCIMLAMTDNSRGGNSLPQNAWRFDFEKPLVTLTEAAGAQNQLMKKISDGTPANPSTSGVKPGTTGGNVTQSPNPSPSAAGVVTYEEGGVTHYLSAPNVMPSPYNYVPSNATTYTEGAGRAYNP